MFKQGKQRVKPLQKGFSLIELMIVIAIVGILASLAIPAYQDYTARAQVAEAFTLAAAQKFAVTEYHASMGKFPTKNEEAGISTTIEGKYVRQVTVGVGAGAEANKVIITAVMKNSGVAASLAKEESNKLVLKGEAKDGSYLWECNKGAGTTISMQYLPAVCR